MAKTKVAGRGRLLGIVPNGGQWLAVVQSFTTDRACHPILSELVPVEDLKGSPRRKASRWLTYMGAAPLT